MIFYDDSPVKMKQFEIIRGLIRIGVAFIFPVFLAFSAAHGDDEVADDYSRLLKLIQLDDRQQPQYIFNDFEEEFDAASHRASQQYFNEHPGLIERIKRRLKGGKLRWQLGNMKHRLLFVPETRAEYATLYRRYCRDIIRAVLDKTGFDNPYGNIENLKHSKPAVHEHHEGITAYIVHNLAKEYVGTYIFSNYSDKKVEIELKGKLYSGEVGSYSSTLSLKEDGTFEFVNDRFTIWQNSASNPYTALMAPVEETLHITLRRFTESAIVKAAEQSHHTDVKSVEKIVEDWMAVEEAIVGGIVYRLLPPILERCIAGLSPSHIESDRITKRQFEKYRHLEKGITVVQELGPREAIRMYSKNPTVFRDLLL